MLIIKLGGSVLQDNDSELNSKVSKLVEKLEKYIDETIVITMGGGRLCRMYNEGLKANGVTDDAALHDLGTQSCNFQAEYLRHIFPKSKTYPVIVKYEEGLFRAKNLSENYKYIICGAWNPGASSDFNSALAAKSFGSVKVLRISNIDYVYDADPKVKPDAKKCEKLTWDEYLNIIDNVAKHSPGSSYPVDPLAARLAKEQNMKFYFTSLDKFLQIESAVDFDNFYGTVIG